MIKRISPKGFAWRTLIWGAEAAFTLIVPIYLYGFLKGLLIHSALSSLLHIASLLAGMSPRYVVVRADGKEVEDHDEISKAMKEDK